MRKIIVKINNINPSEIKDLKFSKMTKGLKFPHNKPNNPVVNNMKNDSSAEDADIAYSIGLPSNDNAIDYNILEFTHENKIWAIEIEKSLNPFLKYDHEKKKIFEIIEEVGFLKYKKTIKKVHNKEEISQ